MPGELGIFETLVRNLNAMGFYGFVLPWLLVFALVYGLLSIVSKKTGMDSRVNGLIALAIAFFITAYSNIGTFFVQLFGGASMIFAAGLVIVLFLAIFGISPDASKTEWVLGVIILGIILLFVIGGARISGLGISNEVMALLFMVFVMIFAITFVTKGEKKQ